MSVKDAVIEMIRALPDDVTWAEIRAAIVAEFGTEGHSPQGSDGPAQGEIHTGETPPTPE